MSFAVADNMVERFQDAISSVERIGVSEFARSKSWREKLPTAGCFEVTDRNGVVGYMLAPEYAKAINVKMLELEAQAEKAQIDAMFAARADYDEIKEGQELVTAALNYFDENIEELLGAVDGD